MPDWHKRVNNQFYLLVTLPDYYQTMIGLSSRMPDGRLNAVQTLRGVAVLLVILVHSINVADYRFINRIEAKPGWIANFRSLNEFGACGVDLFFVLSGFVMGLIVHRAGTTFSGFLRDRFNRIVPLYWLMSGGYVVLLQVLRLPLSERGLAASFFILPGLHYVTPVLVVGWSLAYELAFYSLVMVVTLCRPTNRRLGFLIVLVFGVAAVGQLLRPLDGIAAVYFNPMIAEFGVGLLCFWLWQGLNSVPNRAAVVLMIAGCSLLAVTCFVGFEFSTGHMYVLSGETGAERTGAWALPWAMILLGLLWLTPVSDRYDSNGSAVLRLMGNASYSLYLVHMFPCTIAERLLPANVIPPDALVLATAAIAVVLGLATHIWIEQPLLRVMRRRRGRAELFEPLSRPAARS